MLRNIEEFRLYRDKKKRTDVLRTESDWDIFWSKLHLNATGAQPRNMEWSILNSCIMGYRSGRWDIPGLNDKTLEKNVNGSTPTILPAKSSNLPIGRIARRPERQANMLPREMIKSKLEELMNADI